MKTKFLMLGAVAGFALAMFPACGAKTACDATTCASGCCDAEGTCRPGTAVDACGAGGHACVACQSTQTCSVGACSGGSMGGGTGGGAMGGGMGGGGTTGGGTGGGGAIAMGDVVVNELAASDGDFVELFNKGTAAVDLSGYMVADLDSATSGPKFADGLTLPAGTTIAPGEHLLFVSGTAPGPTTSCLDAGVTSCFEVAFGLSNGNGDAVFLLLPDAGIADQVTYPANGHQAGNSWGRLPDGTGNFMETARTPGAVNMGLGGGGGDMDGGAGGGGGDMDGGAGGGGGDMDAGAGGGGGDMDAGTGGGGGSMVAAEFAVVLVGPAADGGNLSNASAPVTIEVRDVTTGAVSWSQALPVTAAGSNQAFALSGSATSEGVLNASSSGSLVALAGYAAVPGIASVNGATLAAPRVVARVGLDGGVDTSTLITDAYPGNNVRSAATVDGTAYWTGGTGSNDAGVRYVVQGSTGMTTEVNVDVQNIRATGVYGGQLYAATQSGTAPSATVSRVFAVGTGTPTTAAAVSYLPGVMLSNPHGFVLLDLNASVAGVDTLYVADTTNGAGVRKYVTADGMSWTEADQFPVPSTTTCFNVAAKEVGGTVVVLCSTGPAIYRWDDLGPVTDGGVQQGTVLVNAPAGTAFRGVTFVP